MKDLREQEDLTDQLDNHYSLVGEGEGYAVIDLRERIE
jgi:hypothetical protein